MDRQLVGILIEIRSMKKAHANYVAGIKPLRAAIANLYNAHHRAGKESQYSWENVCVVPGGRAGLIRIAAVLGHAYLGFFMYALCRSMTSRSMLILF
jgi:hypothetical protein